MLPHTTQTVFFTPFSPTLSLDSLCLFLPAFLSCLLLFITFSLSHPSCLFRPVFVFLAMFMSPSPCLFLSVSFSLPHSSCLFLLISLSLSLLSCLVLPYLLLTVTFSFYLSLCLFHPCFFLSVSSTVTLELFSFDSFSLSFCFSFLTLNFSLSSVFFSLRLKS